MTAADVLHVFQFLLRLIGPGLYLLLAMLAVELVNLLALRKLNGMGIVPREPASLAGIVAAPFLHDDLRHFAANIVPLALLAFLLGRLQPLQFWWITAAIVLGTGLLVWLLARRRNHFGASGLIYGSSAFSPCTACAAATCSTSA